MSDQVPPLPHGCRTALGAVAALAVSANLVARVFAADSIATDAAVMPASAQQVAEHSATAAARETVRFTPRQSEVGDRVAQEVSVDMQLQTQITQDGQTANESVEVIRARQRRHIEVLAAEEGRATYVQAHFPVSRRQSREDGDRENLVPQVIEGKTYRMRRDGDQMQITDAAGLMPTFEEYELVRDALENVGKPNPLAAILANREVAVGATIQVPREQARALLGLQSEIGDVRRFELTLKEVAAAVDPGAAKLAQFEARIEVVGNDEAPMSMSLQGAITLEAETCRLLRSELAGPVNSLSVERTQMGMFQYAARGQLGLAAVSHYGVAPK